MDYLKNLSGTISGYVDMKFFIKFILGYLILYYFTPVYVALADPKGVLNSEFIHHHYVNYISFLEAAIINTANFLAHILGLPSYVIPGSHSFYESTPIIKIDNGASVILSNGCLGFGVMSFWISFIISHEAKWRKKVLWSIAGVLIIFIINCLRITFLLYAQQNKWRGIFTIIDHHTLFNIVAYIFIFFMAYSFYESSNSRKQQLLTIT